MTPPPPQEQLQGDRPFRPAPVPPQRYGRGTRPGLPVWHPPRHRPLVLTLEGMAVTKAVMVAVTTTVTAGRGAPLRGTGTVPLPVLPLHLVLREGTGQERGEGAGEEEGEEEQGKEEEAEGGLAACLTALRAAAAVEAVERQAMQGGGWRARPTLRGKLGGSWSFARRSCRQLRTRRVTWPTLRLSSRRWRSGSRSSSRYGHPSGGSLT